MYLIVTTLFSITTFAGDNDISGNVQADLKSIHAIQMLNRCPVFLKLEAAVGALTSEGSRHGVGIYWVRYT